MRSEATEAGSRSDRELAGVAGVADYWAFIVPCTIFLEVALVGRLFLSELLLVALFPALLRASGNRLWSFRPRAVILLASAWLAAQMYSDATMGTPFDDWARGWSKIAFFILNFSALYLLLFQSRHRLVLFAQGLSVGLLLQYLLNRSMLAENHPWKFGIGQPITLLLVLYAQSLLTRSRVTTVWLIVGAAVLNFILGFRSLGAFCFITAAVVFFGGKQRRLASTRSLVLVVVFSIYALSKMYGYAAETGLFGQAAKEKYVIQSSGEFGLLLGARVELFASTQAIMDSPIVGHGSWARNFEYVALLNERLIQFGYEIPRSGDDDLLPSHSYFMSAWVEAGIVGALFWLFILSRVVGAIRTLIARPKHPLYVVGLYLGIHLIWDILFSPFGGEGRLVTPYVIVMMLIIPSIPDSPGSIVTPALTPG